MTQFTDTIPPIEFEREETSPDGARFILHPNATDHTDHDVIRAKRWLRDTHIVNSIQVRWTLQAEPDPTLMKIPDYIIIKNLTAELAKKEEYIQELEDKIQDLSRGVDTAVRKEIKSESAYKDLRKQLEKSKSENTSLRKQISELVIRLNSTK